MRKDSFLCPNGTIFHQLRLVCDWWYNVECSDSSLHEGVNAEFGKVDSRGSQSHSVSHNNNANNLNSFNSNSRSHQRTQSRQFTPVVDLPGSTGVTGQSFNLGSHIPALSTSPSLPDFETDTNSFNQVDNFQGGGATTRNRFNDFTDTTVGSPFLNAFQNNNELNQLSNAEQRGNFNNIPRTTTVSPFIKAFQNQLTSSTPSRITANNRLFSNTRTTGTPRRPTQQSFKQTGRPLDTTQRNTVSHNHQQSFNANSFNANNFNSITSGSLGKPLSQSQSPGNNFVNSFAPSTATIAPTTVAQQHHLRNQQNRRTSARRPVPTVPVTTPRPVTTPVRQPQTTIAVPEVTTLRPSVTQTRELLNHIQSSAKSTPARPSTNSRRNQVFSSTGKPLPIKTTVSRTNVGRGNRRGPTLTKVFRTPLGQAGTTPLKPINRGNEISSQTGPFFVKPDDSDELVDISDEVLISTSNLGNATPNRLVQTNRNRKKLTSGRNRISIGSPVSVPQVLSPIAGRNRNRLDNLARNNVVTSEPAEKVITTQNNNKNPSNQAFGIPIDPFSTSVGTTQSALNNNLGGVSQVAISPSAGVLSADVIRKQQEKRARENQLRKQKLQQAFQQQKAEEALKRKSRPTPRLPFPVPNNAIAFPNIAGARPVNLGRPLFSTNVQNNNKVTQAPRPTSTSVSAPAQRFVPPPVAAPASPRQNSIQQLHNRRAQQNQQRQQQQQQQAVNQLTQNVQQTRQNFNNQQQRIRKLQEQQILRQQQNIERQNHNIEIQQQKERNHQNSLNNRNKIQNTGNNIGNNHFRVVLDDDYDDDFDDRFDGDDHFDDDKFDDDLFDDDRFDLDDRFDDDRFDLDDDFDDDRFDLDDRFDDDRFDDDRFDDDRFDDDRFDLDDRFDDLDDDLEDRFDNGRFRNRPTTRFNRQSGSGSVSEKDLTTKQVAPPSEVFLPPPPLPTT